MAGGTAKTLWVTYAWVDTEGGNFDFIVNELSSVGVRAEYDRIQLVPGQRLWEQIGERITKGPFDGWAYLLTPSSLKSEPCREELAYATYRALTDKGAAFPLMGLLLGVSIDDVPPALKVRLCINMADPAWKEQVKAGLERRAPTPAPSAASKYVWRLHRAYGGDQNAVAVEVQPRFGELLYWRFAYPEGTNLAKWGHGPSNGGGINGMRNMAISGRCQIDGRDVAFCGSSDRLSASVSAYLSLRYPLPDKVYFGTTREAAGPLVDIEAVNLTVE